MSEGIHSVAATAPETKKRCAFAISDSSNEVSSPSRPQQNKRRFRPEPRAAGGLSHTAPPLGGPVGASELTVLTTKDSSVIRRWLYEHVLSFNEANNDDSKVYSVLGFDVETIAKPPWRPERASLPDGPATIQLSTPDSCLIVQLATIGDGSAKNAPSVIRDVVNNPNIIKVGVGIDDDALDLYRWSKEVVNESDGVQNGQLLWEMTSRFDLGCILPNYNVGRRIGLREIAKTVLGVEIKKSKKLQMSNWGTKHLTDEQISYAARDAWVSAAVVAKLHHDNNDVFSPKALMGHEFMKSQRSLKELDERAVRRKNAKIEHKSLLEQEESTRDVKRIEELKKVMELYRPDYPPSFPEGDFILPFY
ncbi:hypothetical protein ACHAXN_010041 [Cyclotella atomus]